MRLSKTALVLLVFVPTGTHGQETEMRGVWINPQAWTQTQRAQTFAHVKAAGLNTVFLRAPSLKNKHGLNHGLGAPDDFKTALALAKANGLAVHAWLTNKQRTGADQVDFTDPNEQRAQTAWAVDMLKTYRQLDGIHFDYIRYTTWAPPNAAKISAIEKTIAQTKIALQTTHPGAHLTAAVFIAKYSYLGAAGPNQQAQWSGDVPPWYQHWHQRHPNNYFVNQPVLDHAAGRFKEHQPHWRYGPTFFHYQQNPPHWLERNAIDGIMPMRYTADTTAWTLEAETWKAMTGQHFSKVHMGLGWLTEKGRPDWKRDPKAIVQHIRNGRRIGVNGFCLFALGVDKIDDRPIVQALGGPTGPFGQPARSPLHRLKTQTPP